MSSKGSKKAPKRNEAPSSSSSTGRTRRSSSKSTLILSILIASILAYSIFGDLLFQWIKNYHHKKPVYDMTVPKAPVLSGFALQAFLWMLEKSPIGNILFRYVSFTAGLPEVHNFAGHLLEQAEAKGEPLYPTLFPSYLPTEEFSRFSEAQAKTFSFETVAKDLKPYTNKKGSVENVNDFRFWTIDDYAQAYRSKKTTPTQVAQKIIQSIKDSNSRQPPLKAIHEFNEQELLKEAHASTERFKKNTPYGYFDGVPFAVKDEMAVKGYHGTAGTKFLGLKPSTNDSFIVAKIRDAGGLMIGMATMQEIGIDVYGHNVHHGVVRSAYNTSHYAGGSSSGSAAAVGAGLCPMAIGMDGGGSIRIPAAFNGVVGLKPTYGRVSLGGATPLCWTISHAGPIAATVRDAALSYALMAGKDPKDWASLLQPAPHLANWNDLNLSGLRVGIFKDYNDDSAPEFHGAVAAAMKSLEAKGAKIVAIEIPHLEAIGKAHTVTILSEMATTMERHLKDHRFDFGFGTRTNLHYGKMLRATDYVAAQLVRTWGQKMLDEQVWNKVDVVLSPATGALPPAVLDAYLANGFSDVQNTVRIMRYIYIGNFFGNPAISLPGGYTSNNIPIGLQVMGRNWEEHTVLRVANAIEEGVTKKKPEVFYSAL